MRGRSDILGSLHNRTLHILIRQLPLFINQTGTLQLLAKVVSTGDKYFLAQRTQPFCLLRPVFAISSEIYALFGVLFTGIDSAAVYQN